MARGMKHAQAPPATMEEKLYDTSVKTMQKLATTRTRKSGEASLMSKYQAHLQNLRKLKRDIESRPVAIATERLEAALKALTQKNLPHPPEVDEDDGTAVPVPQPKSRPRGYAKRIVPTEAYTKDQVYRMDDPNPYEVKSPYKRTITDIHIPDLDATDEAIVPQMTETFEKRPSPERIPLIVPTKIPSPLKTKNSGRGDEFDSRYAHPSLNKKLYDTTKKVFEVIKNSPQKLKSLGVDWNTKKILKANGEEVNKSDIHDALAYNIGNYTGLTSIDIKPPGADLLGERLFKIKGITEMLDNMKTKRNAKPTAASSGSYLASLYPFGTSKQPPTIDLSDEEDMFNELGPSKGYTAKGKGMPRPRGRPPKNPVEEKRKRGRPKKMADYDEPITKKAKRSFEEAPFRAERWRIHKV